jgi:hypothetical protein
MNNETKPGTKSDNKDAKIKKPNFFKSTAGKVVLGFTALTTGLIPGINQSIEIPSTFDPSALDQWVGAQNSVQMTFEEYEATNPTLWNPENRAMTIPIPVIFRDGRTPTLHVEKTQNPYINDGTLNFINIDGLEQGDTLLAPFDGEIQIVKGSENLATFFLRTKDSQGRNISLTINTTGLNPLFEFDHNMTDDSIFLPIKRGDLIGSLLTSNNLNASKAQVEIIGHAPLLENFNFATTSGGKVIEITQ